MIRTGLLFCGSSVRKAASRHSLAAALLAQRACLRVSGPDSAQLLQGLVTNDVDILTTAEQEGVRSPWSKSLSCLFLNAQGRVLFDTLLVASRGSDDDFLIDCDRSKANQLAAHLKVYRVRKKVDIQPLPDLQVYAVYKPLPDDEEEPFGSNGFEDTEQGELSLPPNEKGALRTMDPRISQLGVRIYTSSADGRDVLGRQQQMLTVRPEEDYILHRYRLGVGEGPSELVPSKALPLESNADYANGVSFHKGCYVGQELTARTHHTGVIRKRLMPLKFVGRNNFEGNLKLDSVMVNESDQEVGRIRGVVKDKAFGLGLMRIKESLAAGSITLRDDSGIKVKVHVPCWWPKDNQVDH